VCIFGTHGWLYSQCTELIILYLSVQLSHVLWPLSLNKTFSSHLYAIVFHLCYNFTLRKPNVSHICQFGYRTESFTSNKTVQTCKVPQSLVLFRVQKILGSNFGPAERLFQMSIFLSFLISSRQMSNWTLRGAMNASSHSTSDLLLTIHLSPPKLEFNPRPFHVELIADQVTVN
jgi:hypothetical protein